MPSVLPPDPVDGTTPRTFLRWVTFEQVLFAIILIALIAPIWCFRHFPSTDGGAHVGNADVLIHRMGASGATYRQYYTFKSGVIPNSLGHFLLAGLMLAFSPEMAEKILITLYALLLPISMRYAARALVRNREAAVLAGYLSLPLIFNYLLHQGFYNFCCSVAVYLFTFGYWLRYREHLTLSKAAVILGLTFLLYLSHLFSLAMAYLAIGAMAVWLTVVEMVLQRRGGQWNPQTLWRGFRSRVLITGLIFLPTLILAARFKFASRPTAKTHAMVFTSKAFWSDLVHLGVLVSYRAREARVSTFFSLLLVILCGIAAVVRLRRRNGTASGVLPGPEAGTLDSPVPPQSGGVTAGPHEVGTFAATRHPRAANLIPWQWDILLMIAAGFLFLYFTHGDADSVSLFIPRRLMLYVCLMVILWLASQPFTRWMRRAGQIGAVAAALGLAAFHCNSYAAFNPQLDEFLAAAGQIDPQSTLLPLIFSPRGLPVEADTDRLSVAAFYMAAGFATAQKHAVDLKNYEANLDYFPVIFRPEINPFTYLAKNKGKINGFDALPQRFDILAYTSRTKGRVDYVLVWAVPPSLRNDPATINTYAQLHALYDRIYVSSQGRTELWRRKNYTAPIAP